MIMHMDIKAPECQVGYTIDEMQLLLGDDQYLKLRDDVPMQECKGTIFDPERQKYFWTGCGPHGNVFPHRLVQDWLDAHLQPSQ